MNILRACLNWRVVGVLVAVGAGLALLAPNLIAAAFPLLIVAACPVSMLVMMRTMASHQLSPSAGPVQGLGDRPGQLRERLAATRLEQQQLERELARLESAERATRAEARGSTPAADVGAGPS
jgi:hypothetical protein